MKRTTHLPGLAIWLLTKRLSGEWRDFVVGDLEEEFATRIVSTFFGSNPVSTCLRASRLWIITPAPINNTSDSATSHTISERRLPIPIAPPLREPSGRATFVIRTSVTPATLAQPAVAAIRAIDPEQPVVDTQTMVQVRDEKLTPQHFSALLLGRSVLGPVSPA